MGCQKFSKTCQSILSCQFHKQHNREGNTIVSASRPYCPVYYNNLTKPCQLETQASRPIISCDTADAWNSMAVPNCIKIWFLNQIGRFSGKIHIFSMRDKPTQYSKCCWSHWTWWTIHAGCWHIFVHPNLWILAVQDIPPLWKQAIQNFKNVKAD